MERSSSFCSFLAPRNQPPLSSVLLRSAPSARGPSETRAAAVNDAANDDATNDDAADAAGPTSATAIANTTVSKPSSDSDAFDAHDDDLETRNPATGFFPHLIIAGLDPTTGIIDGRRLTRSQSTRAATTMTSSVRTSPMAASDDADGRPISASDSRASAATSTPPARVSRAARAALPSASRVVGTPASRYASASRNRTRHRHRDQRIGVRFELNNDDNNRFNAAESENVSIVTVGSSPRVGRGVFTLSQRRRLSQRECAIADARLARKFPSCLVRTMSAIHLVICLLVLFVQFWTSARVGRERQWVRSVNTYGYMCALLAGLAGCSGIALFLMQSKNRAICFLCMSVGTASSCCYLLTFYTSYFAEIRMLPSAQGCIEEYDKHPDFKVPFACMTFLTLLGFFNSFLSILVVSTIINRARACWWSCDPCNLCQLDEDVEDFMGEDESNAQLETAVPVASTNLSTQFEMPPAYFEHPPPYKP